MVRPLLEFSSSVWDPHTAKDIAIVERVQRRAARWVSHRYRQTSSVDSMVKTLSWTSLQKRRKVSRLSLFYKYHNSLVAIESTYAPVPSTAQRSTTRRMTTQHYPQPLHRTDYRKMSFFPRTTAEWNTLPSNIKDAPSVQSFRGRISTSL